MADDVMNQSEKKENKRKIWLIGGLAMAIVWIIAVIIKILTEKYTPTVFVLTLIFSAIVYIAGAYSYNYFKFESKKETNGEKKLPQAITDAQCYELAMDALKSKEHANYLVDIKEEGTEIIGDTVKSQVWTIVGTQMYHPRVKKAIIINKHFPNHMRKILTETDPRTFSMEVKNAKRRLASSPESPTETEEIRTYNPLTGTQQSVKKVSHQKKQLPPLPEKKGDLE